MTHFLGQCFVLAHCLQRQTSHTLDTLSLIKTVLIMALLVLAAGMAETMQGMNEEKHKNTSTVLVQFIQLCNGSLWLHLYTHTGCISASCSREVGVSQQLLEINNLRITNRER